MNVRYSLKKINKKKKVVVVVVTDDQFFSILTTTLSTNNLLFDIVNKIIRYIVLPPGNNLRHTGNVLYPPRIYSIK